MQTTAVFTTYQSICLNHRDLQGTQQTSTHHWLTPHAIAVSILLASALKTMVLPP